MLALSFDTIFHKIKTKKIPKNYTLQSPETIKFSRFLDALNSIESIDDFRYFIDKICAAKNIIIKSNNHSYRINYLEDFLSLYLSTKLYEGLSNEKSQAIDRLFDIITFSKDQLIDLLKK